jgi:hypothetical protein
MSESDEEIDLEELRPLPLVRSQAIASYAPFRNIRKPVQENDHEKIFSILVDNLLDGYE